LEYPSIACPIRNSTRELSPQWFRKDMQEHSAKDIELVSQSPFFDGDWYLQRYKDLILLKIAPAEHYLWLGSKLNRDPSARFSTKGYLEANPDVKIAGVNPLLHFIKMGQREGRSPIPEADPLYFMTGRRVAQQGAANLLLCVHDVNVNLFGGERSFLDVLVQIASLEVNIFITIPKNTNPDYVAFLRRESSGVFQFHYPQWQHDKPARKNTLQRMEAIITENNIDLVYTNTIFLPDFQYVAKKLNRKSFCHVRELINDDPELREKIGLDTKAIVADLWSRSDYLIANSRSTQKAFSSKRQPVYAPNVVDCSQFEFPNPVSKTITFAIISSNTIKKGIADFIEIARLSLERAPSARFWAIGPRNAYVDEMEAKSLPKNLLFKGYMATPQDALSDVNVVMSLSHFAESFGRSVAEAQAACRPVIAYDWGAVPELVQHGVTGFLVPHLDVAAAARAVKKICDDPSLIEKMGAAGRQRMLSNYAPEVLREALRLTFSGATGRNITLRSPPEDKTVTVVIPVYNGYEALKRCLESVKAWTLTEFTNVLVIDDGSLDQRILPLLLEYAEEDKFQIIENDGNIGYTRTINKAIKHCFPNDVILLNSDTIVTPNWVEGLRDTVYMTDFVGTATAMSDHAGAFSFPKANQANPKPHDVSHALWAATIVRSTERCEPVEVPTGNGFCIYIRREVIDRVGLFDEEAFPRGYGEENDFCMRAKAAGWKNLISPKTYIFHERNVSFGIEKASLIEHATEVMSKRFPSYFHEVEVAFSSHNINRLRAAVACVSDVRSSDHNYGDHVIQISSPAARLLRLNEALINWDYLGSTAHRRERSTTSIIICVHNNPEKTDKCVRSIISCTTGINIEIILVDNGSDAETIAILNALCNDFIDVRTVYNYENLNFSLGRNIGFAASIGQKIVFLNSDVWVTENWLAPLVASLDDETIKGAQPRVLASDGTIQCVGVVFSRRDPFGYPIYSGGPNSSKYAGRQRRLKAITASCMAMRAADFVSVRGFDARFINGQEDIDLCLRLNTGASSFLYVPTATVYRSQENIQVNEHKIHNETEFFMRWNKKVMADDTTFYDEDGVTEPQSKVWSAAEN
jgi:GT2 family glycosyltransferase/glycosyltransferase involved in cell wall biosynthesis